MNNMPIWPSHTCNFKKRKVFVTRHSIIEQIYIKVGLYHSMKAYIGLKLARFDIPHIGLILDLWGISSHAEIVFGLGKDFFKIYSRTLCFKMYVFIYNIVFASFINHTTGFYHKDFGSAIP